MFQDNQSAPVEKETLPFNSGATVKYNFVTRDFITSKGWERYHRGERTSGEEMKENRRIKAEGEGQPAGRGRHNEQEQGTGDKTQQPTRGD